MKLKKITNKLYKVSKALNDCVKSDVIYKDIKHINRIINIDEIKNVKKYNYEAFEYIVKQYNDHYFDLLGSGWCNVNYGSGSFGINNIIYTTDVKNEKKLTKIINRKRVNKSKEIKRLITENYTCIDWSKDFKSGYRFNSKLHKNFIKAGKNKGVDIKVPWELSRMHHLVQMAIWCILNEEECKKNILEFKNQTLDFFWSNTVNFGVNWVCAMDVGIRIVNILIAYDIFKQIDSYGILDNKYDEILIHEVKSHLEFVYNNLENDGVPGNHYLTNIASLIIGGAYLEEDESKYLDFAIEEFFIEFNKQFHDDGGSFEASTAYHRLSSEISTVALAYLIYIDVSKATHNIRKRIDKKFINKLSKVHQFNKDILKSSGEIIQIGDSDSGRFVKISPIGDFYLSKEISDRYVNLDKYKSNTTYYFDENMINNSGTISFLGAIFNDAANELELEYCFIKSIINKNTINLGIDKNIELQCSLQKLKDLYKYEKQFIYNGAFGATNLRKVRFYKDFGLGKVCGENWEVYLYAGEIGYRGLGAHSHNDKLSVELTHNGKNIITDPGTYLYTCMPNIRNIYRASKAHNIPIPICEDREQNEFFHMFGTYGDTKCEFNKITKDSIVATCEYRDIRFCREIRIKEDKLIITDYSNVDFHQNFHEINVSNGYGKCLFRRD